MPSIALNVPPVGEMMTEFDEFVVVLLPIRMRFESAFSFAPTVLVLPITSELTPPSTTVLLLPITGVVALEDV